MKWARSAAMALAVLGATGLIYEVRHAAAEIATAAAQEVIATRLDAQADAAMVDRAVADLPKALRAA